MLFLDYLAYHNRLATVSLLEKTVLGIGGLCLAVSTGNAWVHGGLYAFMSLLLIWAGMPFSYWLRLWGALLPFMVVSILTILVSFSAEPFSALGVVKIDAYYVGVPAENLRQAEGALLRSAASVACLLFLAGTTPLAHVAAWGSKFAVLRPVLEVSLLAYRFIFVVMHTAGQIYTAQQSRLGYSDLRRSFRSIGSLAANVGRKSFVTARDLFIGLASRNYEDRLVFRYPRQQVQPLRLLMIVAGLVGSIWAGH